MAFIFDPYVAQVSCVSAPWKCASMVNCVNQWIPAFPGCKCDTWHATTCLHLTFMCPNKSGDDWLSLRLYAFECVAWSEASKQFIALKSLVIRILWPHWGLLDVIILQFDLFHGLKSMVNRFEVVLSMLTSLFGVLLLGSWLKETRLWCNVLSKFCTCFDRAMVARNIRCYVDVMQSCSSIGKMCFWRTISYDHCCLFPIVWDRKMFDFTPTSYVFFFIARLPTFNKRVR